MSQFFSYRPRSGSRVLAARPAPNVLIAYPGPGTICAGDIIALSYPAACPGIWWRDTAGRIAKQIIEAVGGLAEDSQGTVTMCVPRCHAYRAHSLMSFGGVLGIDEDANMHALLIGEVVRVGPALALEDASWSLPRLHPTDDYSWYTDDGHRMGVYVGCGDSCPHCEGMDCVSECRCTTYRPLVCPVRLATDAEASTPRFAVRIGLYSDVYDRWGTVWAEIHRHGNIIPVSCWGGQSKVAHTDHAETHSSGQVTWSESFVRTLDYEGNVAEVAAHRHY